MNTDLWRIRPAGSSSEGRAVPFARLAVGIESEEAGEMDEVRAPGETAWVMIGEHPTTSDLVPSRRMPAYRETEEAESDMTPMIDVTFQLVIFFMIAATYTVQKTLDLPASQPDPEAAAAVTMEELEEENIIVKVAADGTVMVQDQVRGQRRQTNPLRQREQAARMTPTPRNNLKPRGFGAVAAGPLFVRLTVLALAGAVAGCAGSSLPKLPSMNSLNPFKEVQKPLPGKRIAVLPQSDRVGGAELTTASTPVTLPTAMVNTHRPT